MPFTNHGQHLELYLNGKYEGNYLLTEQIDVHKGRVEVDTLAGGFLAGSSQRNPARRQRGPWRLQLAGLLQLSGGGLQGACADPPPA